MGAAASCASNSTVNNVDDKVGQHAHPKVSGDVDISWPEWESSPLDLDSQVHLEAILESDDEDEESDHEEAKRQIMEDARMLKSYAKFHLHPEDPVVTTDPTAFARNFFSRPGANLTDPEPKEDGRDDDSVMSEERERLLEETRLLETYNDQSASPENEVEEKDKILQDVDGLRKFAHFHLHPEEAVKTEDPLLVHTNFFDRPSAPAPETPEEAEEHHQIVEEVGELRKFAHFHLHPEEPVRTEDPMLVHTNFFDRPSAPPQETPEEAEEHHQIMDDLKQLEENALKLSHGEVVPNYFHPATEGCCEYEQHALSSSPQTTVLLIN